MARALTALALLIALPPLLATGQEPAPGKYRIEFLGEPDTSDLKSIVVRFRITDAEGRDLKDLPNEPIRVFEDGRLVKELQPGSVRREDLAAVLAMDTSGSMERHEKMVKAKEAAEGFFRKLDPKLPCGLVLFHHQPYEQVPPQLDRAPLLAHVRAAKADGGTAYVDAIAVAIRQLAEDKTPNRQRAVVLMTDGRDVNSQKKLPEVIAEARKHKVRVYTLGLGEPGRNEPVRTVLVLDRSGSMKEGTKWPSLKAAALRFIELMPAETADTTIIPFDDRVPPAPSFTRDKAWLMDEIRSLVIGRGTALYDAAADAVETLHAAERGDGKPVARRRAVVVLTDGRDFNSRRNSKDDLIRRARKERIPIYMIGLGEDQELDEPGMREIAQETGGEYYHVRNPENLLNTFEGLSISLHDDGIDEASLKKLAEDTGGRYLHIAKANELAFQFEAVAGYLETSFAVRYASPRDRHDGTARKVEIHFGSLASVGQGYRVHGLITPKSHHVLYLGLLAGLLGLLAAPAGLRRLLTRQAPAA
jgi:VWFA-related protein